MVRRTTILLRQLPALTSKHVFNTPAIYSLGISYAGKDSPPFISPGQPPSKAGFAHVGHDKRAAWGIRDWVNESLSIRAGRGELDKGSKGGWKDDMADQVGRWGAGEDFFAIDEFRMSQGDLPSTVPHLTHLAISDGVGGWSDTVDPSFFSQALMYHYSMTARQILGSDQADSGSYTSPYSNPHRSEKITNNGQSSSGSENQPLEFLAKAYELLEKDGNVVAGGATACAVSLDRKGQLQGVNLGDSGCTILRDGQIIFTTPSLTHYFNCPKQLSKIPKHMAGQGVIRDKPRTSSDTFTAQLQPGDIVLLYTDGLCDNVPAAHFPLLLQRIKVLLAHPDNAHLSPLDRSRELARLYADVLVAYGRMAMTRTGEELEEVKDDKGEVTVRKSWRTPFEVEAAKEGMRYLGGKVDDITVIAAVVDELNPEDE